MLGWRLAAKDDPGTECRGSEGREGHREMDGPSRPPEDAEQGLRRDGHGHGSLHGSVCENIHLFLAVDP